MTTLAFPTLAAIGAQAVADGTGRSDLDVARDEDFWANIARAYLLDRRYTILNGGGNNPIPREVIAALSRYDQMAASQPRPHNYTAWGQIDEHRVRLARLFNCHPETLAITRNTTEGLNVVASGLTWQAGDEIILSNFEYSYATEIFEQAAQRFGVELRIVDLPHEPSVADVVDRYQAVLSPRTKLLVASHVVDGWGYVLPVRELSQLAHQNGAEMLVDGALSFGQMPVDMAEIGCDYYATSLHKWLNAPLGTGALYVREDRISNLWPIHGVRRDATDIRKFEDIGTRCGPTIAAIGQAIRFYEQIGPSRKLARLRYLTSRVLEQLSGVAQVRVLTEAEPEKRTGLARISVLGVTGPELTTRLREEYDIYTWGNFPGEYDGVYISPNVFNTSAEMDQFSDAIVRIAAS